MKPIKPGFYRNNPVDWAFYKNKTGLLVTGGATRDSSVSFISKLAMYIHNFCDKKKNSKSQPL